MKYLLTAILLLFAASKAVGQESVATVYGHVRLNDPGDAENFLFGMQEMTSGTVIEAEPPDTSGNFAFPLLPFARYNLFARYQGKSIFLKRVVVSSPVPIHLEIDSIPEIGEFSVPIGYPIPHAHTRFSVPTIPELPVANTVDAIEAIQQNSPGIVSDLDGRMHLRGEAIAPQFVIDGIPISIEETRPMSPLFDASLVETADMIRGGFGPQYGSDGILNLAAKSGFDATNFGHAEYDIGTNGNSSQGVDLGGRGGNIFSYYGSYGGFSTDRYLDPISGPDPNHTNGSGSDYFGKIDVLPSKAFTIHALGYYYSTKFQIPNISTASLQYQEESLITTLFSARVDYSPSQNSILSAMGYTRRNDINVQSNGVNAVTDSASLGAALLSDRYFIGARSQDFESGGQVAYSARTNWFGAQNEFNLAGELEFYPLSEYLSFFDVASPPIFDSVGLGRRPSSIDTSVTGKRMSACAEDRITSGDWTIAPGLRYDIYELLNNQSGLSPRVNVGWHASDALSLRASYNHIFEQAPLQNILASSGFGSIVQAQKSNHFELGARYALNHYFSLDLSGYYKSLDNMIAEFQVGNTGVFLPANLTSGTIAGGELELDIRDWNHLYGLLSVSTCSSKAPVPSNGVSPFDGGFPIGGLAKSYADASIGQSSFNTEFAEPLSATWLLRYQPVPEFFAMVDGRFDSGLPFGLADTNGSAPDATRSRQILESRGVSSAAIDLLNLSSTTTSKSIAPHAIFNFSIGYNISQFGLPIMITGSVVNIFNTVYLDHFDPVAGGTYYGTGRSFLLEAELSP